MDVTAQWRDFLRQRGTAGAEHTGVPFVEHLRGTAEILRRWGAPGDVVAAGYFHSIYGTQSFDDHGLSLEVREALRGLIGARAERLAYVFCAAGQDGFDDHVLDGGCGLVDRFTGAPLTLDDGELDALVWIHLANHVEQMRRLGLFGGRGRALAVMARRAGFRPRLGYLGAVARARLGNLARRFRRRVPQASR